MLLSQCAVCARVLRACSEPKALRIIVACLTFEAAAVADLVLAFARIFLASPTALRLALARFAAIIRHEVPV